ncbi:MAG: type IV pilus assembly protein PilM [Thermodesulfobacteriota bacterium]|nr:MAG: type IV pilus assembly protein PilM [Thermodesulfobacteriota bacterium]
MPLSISNLLRKKESVALDIGSSSIKVVQMAQSKTGWELQRLGMKELPPEAIVDGSIIDSMTVIATIKDLLKEHSIKAKDAVAALTGHSVIIKKVSFPAVTEEELSDSIQWEAEQYIPFPVTEVNIDFQILGADTEGRGQMDVMLVAVKKDVINDYTNVIKEAGLNPVVIDVDAFALENMLEINYAVVEGEMVALVNIGASITSFSILAEGVTTFTRSIPMGGNQFTEEIQRELSVSFREAEDLKTGRAGDQENPKLASAIDSISMNLTLDIKRSLDFFLGGSQDVNINKIYLSGGGSKTRGLKNMIQEKTSMPVEMVDPFKNVGAGAGGVDAETLADLAPYFGVGVGLGTRRFGDR